MKKTIAIALSFCLLISSIFIAPIVQAETTYARYAWDFEDEATPKNGDLRSAASGSTTAISIKEKALSLSISNTSAMDGRYISYYVPVDGLKVDTEYQVSGRYKLVKGDLTHLRFGSFGGAKSGTNGAAYSNYYSAINNTSTTAMTDFTAFSGSFTSTSTTASSNATNSDPKYLIIGMYVTPSSTTSNVELLVDDLVFAEVVDDNGGVTASTSNADMGTASVANANNTYTNFAKGETAVFTATPADGYEFAYWKNTAGEKLYGNPYSMTVETDTTLTAYFQKAYGRYAWDFEDGATPKNGDLKSAATGSSTAISIKEKALSLSISSSTSGWDKNYISYYIPVDGLKRDTTYHVSGSYKLVSGTITYLRFGSYGDTKSGTNGAAYSSNYPAINNTPTVAMNDFKAFFGTFTSNSGKNDSKDPIYLIIGMYVPVSDTPSNVELLVDDLVFAEVVDDNGGVTATASNADMGSASVANANNTYTNFAKGETAVFTATPKRGYAFEGWYNGNAKVENAGATYKVVLNADLTLTAKFKKVNLQTAWNNAVAVRTAGASSTGKQGMRVYNSIDKTVGDAAEEYGSIAIRKDYLTNVQGALQSTNGFDLALYEEFEEYKAQNGVTGSAGFGRGISYKENEVAKIWDSTDTEYGFTSYLTEIDPKYYGDTYLVRSYMIDANGNVTYGDIYEASVFNTVYNILQQETEGDGVTAANAIIAEAGQAAYNAWVAENYPKQ